MPEDAVYVFCNMTNAGETCIFPDIHTAQMPNIPWDKESRKDDVWYSDLRGGFKVSYDILCAFLNTQNFSKFLIK